MPAGRRAVWESRIRDAEAQPPVAFPNNGWVVHAFQAAWSAIVHAPAGRCAARPDRPESHLEEALHEAIRSGGDPDTVAAIAGALLGARWGASAVPGEWRDMLHSRYGHTAADLEGLARRICPR